MNEFLDFSNAFKPRKYTPKYYGGVTRRGDA